MAWFWFSKMSYDMTWGGSVWVDISIRFPVVGCKRLSQALGTPPRCYTYSWRECVIITRDLVPIRAEICKRSPFVGWYSSFKDNLQSKEQTTAYLKSPVINRFSGLTVWKIYTSRYRDNIQGNTFLTI